MNDHWTASSALDLCAYVMWRLNWIHPFLDGNGRTSRAVSYLVLCARLGDRLPGRLTIPEQIATDRAPYYEALEDADRSCRVGGAPDLSAMHALLRRCLAAQLGSTFNQASAIESDSGSGRKLH